MLTHFADRTWVCDPSARCIVKGFAVCAPRPNVEETYEKLEPVSIIAEERMPFIDTGMKPTSKTAIVRSNGCAEADIAVWTGLSISSNW